MLSGLMEMDHGIGTEEHVAVGSCNNNNSHVIKGKRTKRRLKPLSPCVFTTTSTAVTSSCSSASCGGGGGGSFSSTTFEGTTDQEEEDMAKCLILLAQGKREREEEEEGDRDRHPNHHQQQQHQQYKLQKAENHVSKSGLVENYECKTCNRTFPSFQALGGHRASHKKPKMQVEKKSSPPPFPITATTGTSITGTATLSREFEEGNYDYKQSNMMMSNIITNAPPVSLELRCGGVNNNKPNKPKKIHECSICGSEFTSGQALGGHMRRHRASTSSNNNNNVDIAVTTLSVFEDVNVRPRNVLELDLNLPALPEDDMFQFPATRESVVLSSAPALVGCHY